MVYRPMKLRRWSLAYAPRPSWRPRPRSTHWLLVCRVRSRQFILPADFPTDIAIQLRPPYEAQADAIMYRQVIAAVATARGWALRFYDAKTAESDAAAVLKGRADEVLRAPRDRLGPPWTKDHRTALAATILTAADIKTIAPAIKG